MKISKLFHWLYATLMFLPLLVAPIFGIYSHRHTIDSYSIDVPNYEVVRFNQLSNPNSDVDVYNCEVTQTSTGLLIFDNTSERGGDLFTYDSNQYFSIVESHKYYLSFYCQCDSETITFYNFGLAYKHYTVSSSTFTYINDIQTCLGDSNYIFPFGIGNVALNSQCYLDKLNVIDLTLMFGAGNEPTLQQFTTWYTNDFYDYSLPHRELLQTGISTYNDTDIGSQFVYTIYGTLDNYFNFSKVFGLNQLGEYMYLNWFYGNSYIGFSCFFLLLTYWLLISLCWLIFDLLMYVPNLVHRWLDRGAIQ